MSTQTPVLTRQQIQELPADHDTDLLVIEQVLGWQLRLNRSKTEPITFWHDDQMVRIGLFMPTFDISDAWQLVEKYQMSILAPGASFADGEYMNIYDWQAETTDGHVSAAPTACLAICRAALSFALKPPKE